MPHSPEFGLYSLNPNQNHHYAEFCFNSVDLDQMPHPAAEFHFISEARDQPLHDAECSLNIDHCG